MSIPCLKALPVQGRHFPCRGNTSHAGDLSLRACYGSARNDDKGFRLPKRLPYKERV
ncbi:MAG: hypothetical protein IKZ88_02680 [Neisseriaceae bacterium]|nr:hypothetical protein [Neisseriaceae bacterium]